MRLSSDFCKPIRILKKLNIWRIFGAKITESGKRGKAQSRRHAMPRFLDPGKWRRRERETGEGRKGRTLREREQRASDTRDSMPSPASLPSKIQRHLQSSSILQIPPANQTFQVHEDRRPKIRRSKWIQIFSDTFLSYPNYSGKEVQLQIEPERKSLRDHTNLQNIKWRYVHRSDASHEALIDNNITLSARASPGRVLYDVCILRLSDREEQCGQKDWSSLWQVISMFGGGHWVADHGRTIVS